MIKMSVFTSDFTSSKIPRSPYGDKTFDFETVECTLRESLVVLKNNFTLNRNYTFPKTTRIRRTKKDLAKYMDERLSYIILDFDCVKTEYARNKILSKLREMDYRYVIGTSRSNNGIDNFNMKGVMEVSGLNTKASVAFILQEIKTHMFRYCKVDISASNPAAYQAPTIMGEELDYNEGSYIPHCELEASPKSVVVMEGSENHQKTVEICLEHFSSNGFVIKSSKGDGVINFEHPSENTKGGWFMYINNPFVMHHFNRSRSFNIFNEVRDRKVVQEYTDELNGEKRKQILTSVGCANKVLNRNERYLTVDDDIKQMVSEWRDSKGLLKIKSAMGTGKSNIIEYVISESVKELKPVLLITNRVSVAKDFKDKYGLKLYTDSDWEIGDSLIVQYDSLWRFSLKYFETIIMDEFMSILIHSRNTLGDYSNLNKVKLQYGLKTKPVLIADAFLYGAEDNFKTTKPVFSINNSFREDIALYEYPNIDSIIQQLIIKGVEARKTGSKVTVSCTSKILAQTIERICEASGLKTVVLSADSSSDEKDIIYKQFTRLEHDTWDVFVYTPTLTVGVSILNKCNDHFHIDESSTTDVISSLQMTRRSRKAKNIHFYVKERKRFLPTDLDVLNNEIRNNIQRYYTKNKNSLLIGIDEEGDFVLSETGIFANGVEVVYNTLENNHRHSFELLLSHQIRSKPLMMSTTQSKFDIGGIKNSIKEREKVKLLSALDAIKGVDYSDEILDEYRSKKYIVSDKDKLLKVMSELRKHIRNDASPEDIAEITRLEVTSKFKFIQELKRLKVFLTKSHSEVKSLISYILSEDIANKSQIDYFKYMSAVKNKGIKLKDRFTKLEFAEIDKKIGYGDFRGFCVKLGYKKRGSVWYLGKEHTYYVRLLV